MAEDIVVKIKTELNTLKETAKQVKMPTGQSEAVQKGIEIAEKAFNAKDWDAFRNAFNKVSKILTNAIASSGNISEALQKAIQTKERIEKSLNDTVDRISKIRSKYVDDTMKTMTKEAAKSSFTDWTKANEVIKSNAGNILGRDEAIIRFSKALEAAGGKIQKVTDDIAKSAGLADRETTFAVNRYIKSEQANQLKDVKEVEQLTASQAQDKSDLATIQKTIEDLTPASKQAADALEQLYKQIVQLTSETNKDVVAQKTGEREIARQASGAALSTDDINNTTQALNKQSSSLGKAFKQFSIYAIALRTVKKALKEAAVTIKDLDKYLTEQAMVTGKTREQTYALLKDYQSMASELGTTTKEIAEVTTQFMRQGKSTADALTLTRAAVSAAKVAGISGAESVNYLTTALNGFQLAAEDAMKVSDKFAAIAATSATSYQEIATALSKVASQANIAGMSIDYTTALLAKGIETTREPAESIGTALKTIIARMRELTDYGKTLEDGMNINNVETQLAYVGIALRNTSGELRSTEEVLDELGQKWNTLSSNQQAAVAKALAGTRQQSRLIAMMTDYERVTELQEIAQRSAGATAAQAAKYLAGMDAALNRVNVTWEKIVTTITDSNVIIGLIDKAANLLEFLNNVLDNDVILMGSLVTLGAVLLINLINRLEMQKAHNRLAIQREKTERDQIIAQKQSYKQALKNFIEAAKSGKSEREKLKTFYEQNKALAERRGDMVSAAKYAGLIKRLGTEDVLNAQEVADAKKELALTESEITGLKIQQTKADVQILQNGQGFVSILGNALSVLTPILTAMTLINMVQQAINAKKLRSIALTEAEAKAEKKGLLPKVSGMFAKVVSAFANGGIPGVIAGITLATALAAALGVGIAASMGAFSNSSAADKAADDVNQLSNKIYELQEKANAIKTIEKQYDALDNKIIKTAADQEKMNELLDSAGDKLDTTNKKDSKNKEIAGSSERDIYNNLQTDQARRKFLDKIEEDAINKANNKRKEQIRILQQLTTAQRNHILASQDNADYLMVQDAVYAINNNTLYEYIDTLGQVGNNVEKLTQNILEQISAQEAYQYALHPERIQELADTINNANTVIGDSQVALAEILDSTQYSIQEKITAYNQLYDAIAALGDNTLTQSFIDAYGQWQQLQVTMSEGAIAFMDRIGISIDKLNTFALALRKFGIETEDAAQRISQLFDAVNNGIELRSAITTLFADVLSQYAPDSKDYKAVYSSILNAYQAAAGTGLLNMGQNLKSLQSQINSLYETASKWSQMSVDEQTQFILDNDALFKGEGGQELFRAFQTGNYQKIQEALANNQVLKEQIRLRLEQLRIDLQIAEAATERNEAEITWLREQIKALEDYEDAASAVYQADLKLRLDQEEKQLNLYKDYLEKQHDALTESLDKRKEAYQNYFDTINKEAENEEYENQAAILSNNLSKLASSTDAGSRAQAKELEQQLQELEKERLETLRERAQEAVLNNLDSEVSQINEKFDKLLENNAALLDAMNKEIAMDANSFLWRLVSTGIENMTATQAEDFIQNSVIPTYDSSISNDILEGIQVRQEGSSLYLTLNNEEIELSNNNQQELSTTILAALRAMGISI